MKDLIEIKIPLKVPSLNVLLRLHWSARSKLKAQWGLFIRRPVDPIYFKKITIIGMQKRLYDYDNFVGGCKELVVDNLRHKNWIKDDNIKNVKIEYLQMKSKKDELIIQFKKEDVILDEYNKKATVTVCNTDESTQVPILSTKNPNKRNA